MTDSTYDVRTMYQIRWANNRGWTISYVLWYTVEPSTDSLWIVRLIFHLRDPTSNHGWAIRSVDGWSGPGGDMIVKDMAAKLRMADIELGR